MLQKEFEERIGREVSQDYYVMADAAYMACGDSVGKDLFCKLWKDKPLELVSLLAGRVRHVENCLREQGDRIRQAGVSMIMEAEKIRCGEDGSSRRVDVIAMRLMGESDYLSEKLSCDVALTRQDRDLLKNRL